VEYNGIRIVLVDSLVLCVVFCFVSCQQDVAIRKNEGLVRLGIELGTITAIVAHQTRTSSVLCAIAFPRIHNA
jgi:hypothetical protein